MRGVALSTIRAKLKAKLRETQEVNSALDTEFNYALASQQEDLANAYDWTFLKDKWDLACSAGSRYLSIPTTNDRAISSTINFERPLLVERLYNTYYNPVLYGIGSEQYNAINAGVTQDPIQRWEMSTNTGDATSPDQIEIWPSPASEQTLRFTGQRVVRALSSDSDRADLDDQLLILFVAAKYAAVRELADAPLIVKEANDHLIKLRASYPLVTKTIVFGKQPSQQREVKLIATA